MLLTFLRVSFNTTFKLKWWYCTISEDRRKKNKKENKKSSNQKITTDGYCPISEGQVQSFRSLPFSIQGRGCAQLLLKITGFRLVRIWDKGRVIPKMSNEVRVRRRRKKKDVMLDVHKKLLEIKWFREWECNTQDGVNCSYKLKGFFLFLSISRRRWVFNFRVHCLSYAAFSQILMNHNFLSFFLFFFFQWDKNAVTKNSLTNYFYNNEFTLWKFILFLFHQKLCRTLIQKEKNCELCPKITFTDLY